jgi:hypothetical protein
VPAEALGYFVQRHPAVPERGDQFGDLSAHQAVSSRFSSD